MSTVPTVDLHDEKLVEDWIGFAAYLADAVDDDVLDLRAAQIELDTDPDDELGALHRAVDVAGDRFGTHTTTTSLLRHALSRSAAARVA